MTNEKKNYLRKSILIFAFSWLGILIVTEIFSLFTVWSINKTINQNIKNEMAISELEKNLLLSRIHFKIQVQEWKNILLRGENEVDFKKYKNAFKKHQLNTKQALTNAFKTCIEKHIRFECESIDLLKKEHEKITSSYLANLISINNISFNKTFNLDRKLRGIDRSIEAKIYDITFKITQQRKNLVIFNQQYIQMKYSQLRRFIVSLMLGALLLSILSLYVLLRRMNKTE